MYRQHPLLRQSVFLATLACASACGDSSTDTETDSNTSTTTNTETTSAETEASETEDTTGTTGPTGGETMGMVTTEGPTTETTDATDSETTDTTDTTDPTDTTDSDTTDSDTDGEMCGNGVVEGDEECDLGPENSDTGACTLMCTTSECGDGLVGPGEACDDGNEIDDDECSNSCAMPGCGDGVVQDNEACDDGNAENSDGCLDTCVEASCGDGFVYADVEACDDGNADNSDACTTVCAPPACDDGLLSGDESDVDCGGDTCEACGLGGACVDSDDCSGALCLDNVCTVPLDCADILGLDPNASTGLYLIDPDGEGGVDPFDAYCDMESLGGGWTLILKADGRNPTFAYAQTIWTDNTLSGEDNPDFDHNEGKLRGWTSIAFGEVMVGLEFPIDDNQNPPVMNYVAMDASANSMFELLSPDQFVATGIGRDQWKTLVEDGSLQPNCNQEGFNVQPNPNPGHHSVRIGIVGNNEGDCATTDSRIGIGGVGTACGTLPDPVGNFAGCGGDTGNVNRTAFGAVFVR